ncbi:MAG: autotransporter outer membrane beta-barrel domain-containing protein [Candidatus Saccharibacteria bacterium]
MGVGGTGFTIINAGSIIGGAGGEGGNAWWSTTDTSESGVGLGGAGGTGGDAVNGAHFTLTNTGKITAGAGGNGGNQPGNATGARTQGIGVGGAGGDGGIGVAGSDFTLTNTGTITGGAGGVGGRGVISNPSGGFEVLSSLAGTPGAGGAGVSGTGFTLDNDTGGTIIGGAAGSGVFDYSNNGGAGVTGSGFTLTNKGSISGGSSSAYGNAANAGAGVNGNDFHLANGVGGTINGGSGGIGNDAGATAGNGSYVSGVGDKGGAGGNGGVGISGSGMVLANSGTVAGGVGGTGGMGYGAVSSGNGGNGGAGIYVGNGSTTTITNNSGATIQGGNGGQDGLGHTGYCNVSAATNCKVPSGNGGMGGAGGTAVSLAAGTALNNAGNISGGNGGAGGAGSAQGNYSNNPGDGGNGGSGGVGVTGTGFTLTNSGAIAGGNGGDAGVGGASANGGANGANGTTGLSGGAGVVATGNATILNAGSISGGLAGDGVNRADAVDLSGGGNTLTLEAGYGFTGNVVSTSGTTNGGDTLALGGSANATFDVSQIVTTAPTAYTGTPQFYGFTTYEKTGGSTWTITGTPSATINWIVDQGAVNFAGMTGGVTMSSLSGSGGSLDLGSNTLTLDTSVRNTFTGTVSGQGMTLQGGGTQILDGQTNFTASATIAGGTLEIGDSDSPSATLTSPQVLVQSGGTLRGHGSVIGHVTNDGTVRPGGSIGVLTINGDYTQSVSGTLTIDVTPIQASELKVNGQASLAGTLNLIYAPGTYAEHTYTLVQADALTGRFATTTASGAPAVLIPDVVYGSTAVYLALATVHPADGALYGNLQQVASLANQQTLGAVLDAALGSAESATDEAAMVPPNVARSAHESGAWVQATGSDVSLDGSPGLDSTGFGLLGGFDAAVADTLHVGVEAGVNQLNANDSLGGHGRIQSVHAGLYAFADVGPLVVSATVDGQHESDRISRVTGVGQALANPDGRTVSGGFQIAWPWQVDGWRLTPKLGALYQHQTLDAFIEQVSSVSPVASAYGVAGARSTDHTWQPYAQMAFAHPFQAWGVRYLPQFALGYRYNTRAGVPTVMATAQDGTVFALPGDGAPRGMATIDARVTAEAGPSWSLSLDYRGQFASHLHDNALSVGFTKRF